MNLYIYILYYVIDHNMTVIIVSKQIFVPVHLQKWWKFVYLLVNSPRPCVLLECEKFRHIITLIRAMQFVFGTSRSVRLSCQLLWSCIYGACLFCASLQHPLMEVWHWHRSGSDQGGMTHCPALIYKRPTSMTHNPVSHHVETRYSYWYVALGVGVLTCITAKDSGAICI